MLPVSAEPARILIFAPNWVGDAVMFTPALRAVRARFPAATLTLIARPAPAAALRPNPWRIETIVDEGRFWPLVRALRQPRADLALLGPNSFRSALTAFLARARQRVGYDRDGRRLLLTQRLQPPRDRDGHFAVTPALDYYLRLASAIGCDALDPRMELEVDPQAQARADELLRQANAATGRPIVFLNPGASFGGSKLYPAGRFAAVADMLIDQRGAQIIINASPAERPIAEAVEKGMNRPSLLNLGRQENSLQLVKALVKRSSLMITNDTGPRHFAAAFGVPVVTIFGSTDPGWTTLNYERERIVQVAKPCGPCRQKECRLPPGSPEFHQCMLKIAPEQVVAAAEELLGGQP